MGNPVPSQERSVDPYASYNSNVVNKITRIVSDGKNILLSPSPIDVSQVNSTTVRAEAGKAIMQDVLIEIQNIDVVMNDADFYIDSSGGVWNETGYYLVVLNYQYQKTSPPPEASIKIILPSQKATLYNPSKHLFLKCVEVNGTIQNLLDFDPDNPAIVRELAGASSGNFVATDKDTTGIGDALYNVGAGITDRFNDFWIKTLHVETISYSSSTTYGTGIYGSGTYGDLAEKYTYDPEFPLEVGTVVEMSEGDYEVEQCNSDLSPFVMGVISNNAAYILNSHLVDAAIVGLVGRIPVKVIGIVKKKDILVSAGNGCLRAAASPLEFAMKVGISMETSLDTNIKLVDCFIK